MIISTDPEIAFDKNPIPIMIKTLNKQEEGNLLKLIKNINKSPLANTIIKDERLNMFLVRLGTRLACHLPPLLCNTVREVLPVLIRQGKKKERHNCLCRKTGTGFFLL